MSQKPAQVQQGTKTSIPEVKPAGGLQKPPAIPAHLAGNGWKIVPGIDYNKMKIVYGIIKQGPNYSAVRIEVMPDGQVLTLALPENMKEITVQRLIELMAQEA
jgi:hypothetical protein